MLVPLLLSIREKQPMYKVPMEHFYRYVGISRQGFHFLVTQHKDEANLMIELNKLITTYRKTKDRRAGSRSLYYNLSIKEKFKIGVTQFERLLSIHGLSLKPLRVNIVTTRSSLQSWNYSNLTSGISISGINEVVVGDITHIYLGGKVYYLFCLTDIYSARIVGYKIGKTMRALEALDAFEMWRKLRGSEALKGCIHHTDGGSQYFSRKYLTELNNHEIKISRADTCLKNGFAEQRNGLIKHHMIPTIEYGEPEKMSKTLKDLIDFYNHKRKQQNLEWKSPVEYETEVKNKQKKLFKFT